MDEKSFLDSSCKGCAHEMSQGVTITAENSLDKMTHKQDVCKKSGSSLQIVYQGQSMLNVNTLPRTSPLVLGGPMPQMLQKILITQSATVSHGCARSLTRGLLKPCSIHSNRSGLVFVLQTFVASKSRSTLTVGSHATLRLVPIVLTLQMLLACSSRKSHRCRIPY